MESAKQALPGILAPNRAACRSSTASPTTPDLRAIDILLVDTRAHKPTLLAIEVKLRATPAGSRNPIPQIIRYRDALKRRNGADWNVRVLLVAGHFSDLVVQQAQAHDLPLTTCNPATGRLLRDALDR